MAVFSKSVFQSVLDRLEDEAPVVEDVVPGGPMVRGLKAGFAVDTGSAAAAGTGHADAYQAFAADPPPEPQMPAHLARIDPGEIAEDLGLDVDDNAETIQDKRRTFALANHPDRVDQAYAMEATLRMMLANRLCDDALARLKTA